jgi:hypothetical protein
MKRIAIIGLAFANGPTPDQIGQAAPSSNRGGVDRVAAASMLFP